MDVSPEQIVWSHSGTGVDVWNHPGGGAVVWLHSGAKCLESTSELE